MNLRIRGFTLGQALLVMAVLVACGSITGLIFRRVAAKRMETADVDNLRQIYAAWAIYQESNDGPAPDLPALLSLLDAPSIFVSPKDPFRGADSDSFPLDPCLPSWPPRAPYRISYGYVVDLVRAGKLHVDSWTAASQDPTLGLLVSPWEGRVEPGSDFAAKVFGPFLAVTMDGAIVTRPPTPNDALSDAAALFRLPERVRRTR